MKILKIQTDKAPKAVGPYSQAIRAGDTIYCSGQIAINPMTKELVAGGIEIETRQVIENLKNVLVASGSDLSHVLKVDVYLKDLNDFNQMNSIYSKYFSNDPKPSRVTVEVVRLPKNAFIEISCVALKK